MSHFCGIVVGKDIPGQLEKYNEQNDVEPYVTEAVTEEEKTGFLEYYTKEKKIKDGISFADAYSIFGEDWNSGSWKQNESGIWENWSTYNPNSKWDWYLVGGRWTGYFKLKEGKIGAVGRPGVGTSPAEKGWADSVIKGDIDIEGMIKDKYNKALKHYQNIASCFESGEIPKLDLKWNDEKVWHGFNIEDKRSAYHAQPAMVKVIEARNNESLSEKQRDSLFMVDMEDFDGLSAEQYAKKQSKKAFVPYCLVINGEWMSRGRMGWWGVSHDESESWEDFFMKKWADIPENEILTLIDFHI